MIAKDKICAVVAAGDAAGMWEQISRALRVTRTVELRLDWLADEGELDRFLARLAKKRSRAMLIATCRRAVAGGKFRGTIAQQLVHLASALRSGCAWYDLEIESSVQCPPELLDVLLGEGRRIASAHFFGRSPKNLRRVAADLRRGGPDAIKIAVQCDSQG
ncbi:MAG TPA: type I 3-dehydroquinate dehydratase, partial [Candidatus Acidoferrales bacterium]|nr:type I 3-dehydroquinate dehydratase [Candidatus Acidoferrales bacterium]